MAVKIRLIGCGLASEGKGCRPHNNPERMQEVWHGNTIKVFCTVCGGWIGNRPTTQEQPRIGWHGAGPTD